MTTLRRGTYCCDAAASRLLRRRLAVLRPRIPELVIRVRAPRVQAVQLLVPYAHDAVLDEPDGRQLIGEQLLLLAIRLGPVLRLERFLPLVEELIDFWI